MYVSWASLMAQTLRICLQSKRLRFNPWVGKILWRKEWLHLDTNYFHFKVRKIVVVGVHSLSCVRLFVTPCTAACQASLSFIISWSLLKLMFIKSVMAIQSSHPLLFPSPPALNLSQHQGLFQRVSSLHQVAKVLELQL